VTQYNFHDYTTSMVGVRRGLGVVLTDRTPNMFVWASEETPTAYLYKAVLSNEPFVAPTPTSFALPGSAVAKTTVTMVAASLLLALLA
jgi:hypothetical protein